MNRTSSSRLGWLPLTALLIPLSAGGLPSAVFTRADVNQDGRRDISDAVRIFQFLFLGIDEVSCLDAADTDDSGAVDISDGIFLLNYLFLGGPPPRPPFPGCGDDPTADALDCAKFVCSEDPLEEDCRASGGTVVVMMCCTAVGDFPNLYLIGPCGCHPDFSHEVKACDCGPGMCFDGSTCVPLE